MIKKSTAGAHVVDVSFCGSVWKASHMHTVTSRALKRGPTIPITAI